MEKNKLTAPVEKLGLEVKAYGDAKLNTLKLQTAKGLSQGIASVTSYLLLFVLGSAFVLVLSMGLILFLGENTWGRLGYSSENLLTFSTSFSTLSAES